jgi:hypothetical protein
MATRAETTLFEMFVAGFEVSSEGFNGEYVSGCHNDSDEPHQHTPELLARLRRAFEDATGLTAPEPDSGMVEPGPH